jgi:ATP-dependent exoDNAse (exonuclease V) beta subunit
LEQIMVPYEWEPWRSEWRVFDEELDLAGSIDFVVRTKDQETGEYVFLILDWKRAKELADSSFNGRERGYAPLQDLQHCNSVHYSLQLNTYKYMLEKNYGIRVVGLALVAMHGEVRKEYEFKPCDVRTDLIERIVQDRKAKLQV